MSLQTWVAEVFWTGFVLRPKVKDWEKDCQSTVWLRHMQLGLAVFLKKSSIHQLQQKVSVAVFRGPGQVNHSEVLRREKS